MLLNKYIISILFTLFSAANSPTKVLAHTFDYGYQLNINQFTNITYDFFTHPICLLCLLLHKIVYFVHWSNTFSQLWC